MKGWYATHREIIEHAIFQDPHLLKVWVWCLAKSTFKARCVAVSTGKGKRLVQLEPGQFIFGRNKAAEALDMPATTVRDRMGRLVELGSLKMESATHFSIVTVVNWRRYQRGKSKARQSTAEQPPTNRHKQPCSTMGNKAYKVHGSVDRIEVQVEDIADKTGRLWGKLGYAGDQGGNLWKAVALRHAGLITESELVSAAEGARLNGRNKPAHFYTCLRESVSKRGGDLKAMLLQIRIQPNWPHDRPARAYPKRDDREKQTEPQSLAALLDIPASIGLS